MYVNRAATQYGKNQPIHAVQVADSLSQVKRMRLALGLSLGLSMADSTCLGALREVDGVLDSRALLMSGSCAAEAAADDAVREPLDVALRLSTPPEPIVVANGDRSTRRCALGCWCWCWCCCRGR